MQPFDENCKVTKRKVLSDIASIFDPLGLVSPIIIRLEIIMQKLLLVKMKWDSELPPQLALECIKYRRGLGSIN